MVQTKSMLERISLYGASGFIGSHFQERTKHLFDVMPRRRRIPASGESLYLISTTDNYNIFTKPYLDVDVNLKLLLSVLRKHKRGDTFNFVSSWFVYGDNGELVSKETSPCVPLGSYAITKLAAERYVETWCKTFGMNYRILRLANVYGPGDKKASLKKNALCAMIEKLKKNHPIQLYWGGDCVRDYIHVYDAVSAIDLCLSKAPLNSVINIGTGAEATVGVAITFAKNALGSSSELIPIDPPEFHKTVQVKDFQMDVSKIKALGFRPKVTLFEGVRQLCQ